MAEGNEVDLTFDSKNVKSFDGKLKELHAVLFVCSHQRSCQSVLPHVELRVAAADIHL